MRDERGVEGNARLTGAVGAVIFFLLAAEGLTLLGVHALISAHVFIGMLLVPLVALKIGTTSYRFVRYYRGDDAYARKGPPPIILRMLGPVVVVLTVGVLATGIAAIAAGPKTRWLLTAHKASFILWFGAMTVHVLGHVLETPALALADWQRRSRSAAPGSATRIGFVVATIAAGIALATLSLTWIGAWRNVGGG